MITQKKELTVILLNISNHKNNYLKKKIAECSNFKGWIFLSNNIVHYLSIKDTFGNSLKWIDISFLFYSIEKTHRAKFIDYIALLGKDKDRFLWDITRVSEKNPDVSHLFLKICYFLSSIDYLKKYPGNYFIFCDSDDLIYLLAESLPSLGYSYKIIQSQFKLSIPYKWKKSLNFLYYFFELLVRICFSRISRKKRMVSILGTKKNCILTHYWLDNRSFLENGSFKDVYYGPLSSLLQNKVNILYLFSDLKTSSFFKILDDLDKSKVSGLLKEDLISMMDIIQSEKKKNLLISFLDQNYPHFDTFDISNLIRNEIINDLISPRINSVLLLHYALKKYYEICEFSSFLYTFENHIEEKIFIKTINRFNRDIRTIGYVHTLIFPEYTCYYCSSIEKELLPLPNLILVNGQSDKNHLKNHGFSHCDIKIIGTLRYDGVLKQHTRRIIDNKKINILVCTSTFNKAVELILLCKEAFQYDTRFLVTIKPHPSINKKHIFLIAQKLPKNFRLEERPFQTIIKIADIVIYTESTVSLEAVMAGIPTICVRSSLGISGNPLRNCPDIPEVSTSDELYIATRQILQEPIYTLSDAKDEVKKYFSKLDPVIVKSVFITDNKI